MSSENSVNESRPPGSSDRLFFMAFVIYLPVSILLVFWLFAVSIIYPAESWQYRLFYGVDGNHALLWLFASLLPAFLFLVFKTRQKSMLVRLAGATGFYCLLASLVSSHAYLALPGMFCIVVSIVIGRLSSRR
ncbi:MAG TPA: hypothetical protein ENJ11_00135 [Gammaproteobacteria bacterium]|nr:hypothetical protein [Gammaproteobacteria bacterium]